MELEELTGLEQSVRDVLWWNSFSLPLFLLFKSSVLFPSVLFLPYPLLSATQQKIPPDRPKPTLSVGPGGQRRDEINTSKKTIKDNDNNYDKLTF